MNRILNIATFTAGFLFFINGVMWLIAPAASAEALGMSLLSGEGLSTQIGDISSFFLVLGSFILLGAYTKQKHWFYAPFALLGFFQLGLLNLLQDTSYRYIYVGIRVFSI